MKRSNKTYLTITGMAASAYFLLIAVIKGREAFKMKAMANQTNGVSVSFVYYLAAALCGLVFGLLEAYYFYSKKNEISIQDLLKNAALKMKVILGGAAGLAAGGLFAFGVIGTIPSFKAGSIEPLESPIAFVDPEKAKEEKEEAANPEKQNQPAEAETKEETKKTETAPAAEQSETKQETAQTAAVVESDHEFPIPDLPPVLQSDNKVNEAGSVKTVSDEEDVSGSLSASASNESALMVMNGGVATLTSSSVYKTGEVPQADYSLLYGVNSAILVRKGGMVNMMDSYVQTDAPGAAGLSCNGNEAYASVSDSQIITNSGQSAALQAMFGGSISGSGLKIFTNGPYSPGFNIRSGSKVDVQNVLMQNKSEGSSLMQGAGTFMISDLNGNALNGNIATFYEGASAEIRGSSISANGFCAEDETGAMFLLKEDPLITRNHPVDMKMSATSVVMNQSGALNGAPLIKTSNTDFAVTLEDNVIRIPSGVLLSQNKGNGTLTLTSQYASGSVEASEGSKLALSLTNGSTLTGSVNSAQSSARISLKLDSSSRLSLIGNCYVDSFENEDSANSNVDFNGYTIYVKGNPISQ